METTGFLELAVQADQPRAYSFNSCLARKPQRPLACLRNAPMRKPEAPFPWKYSTCLARILNYNIYSLVEIYAPPMTVIGISQKNCRQLDLLVFTILRPKTPQKNETMNPKRIVGPTTSVHDQQVGMTSARRLFTNFPSNTFSSGLESSVWVPCEHILTVHTCKHMYVSWFCFRLVPFAGRERISRGTTMGRGKGSQCCILSGQNHYSNLLGSSIVKCFKEHKPARTKNLC